MGEGKEQESRKRVSNRRGNPGLLLFVSDSPTQRLAAWVPEVVTFLLESSVRMLNICWDFGRALRCGPVSRHCAREGEHARSKAWPAGRSWPSLCPAPLPTEPRPAQEPPCVLLSSRYSWHGATLAQLCILAFRSSHSHFYALTGIHF